MGPVSRAPVLLLCLLLVNTLGVSVLAAYALRSQWAEANRNREEADRRALDALAEQLDHALFERVLDPVLMLRTLYRQGSSEADLQQIIEAHGFVQSLFVVGKHGEFVRIWPGRDVAEQRFVREQVLPVIAGENSKRYQDTFRLRSRADSAGDRLRVYVFQTIGAGPGSSDSDVASGRAEEWVVVGSDFAALDALVVEPELRRFEAEHGFDVRLRAPGEARIDGAATADLAYVLPGWRLEMPLPAAPILALDRLHWPTLATTLGLLIAIALIGVAILLELRRQHAVVELRNRFVENVSHELRTPLSLIRMYAETLFLRRITDPGKQHEYHGIILGESQRLSRMIGDVLDFSRLRQGFHVYRLSRSDLAATVREVVDTYESEWRMRGADVRTELDAVLGPVAHDPQGITQVLLNLVDNAIRHAGTSPISIRLAERGTACELAVADLGPGLAVGVEKRLRRSMAAGDMFEEAEGSGLGLSLVRRIADAHGARVDLVPTEPSRGLTVRITFSHRTSRD